MPNYRTPRDLSGQQFGRLTVIRCDVPWSKGTQSRWLCRCDCGGEISVLRGSLTNGNTKSCGCLRREMAAAQKTTHGMTGTSEHQIWKKMIDRCTNPRCKEYKFYGARGIKVCERWRDFQSFYEDVGPRPPGRSSIDRINNDGDYEPTNVRWASTKEQARNKRNNVFVAYMGREMILKDWAEELGISYDVLRSRLGRGWSVDQAFSTPVESLDSPRTITHDGLTLAISEWSDRVGIDYHVLLERTKLGWDAERTLTTPVRAKRKSS